MDLDYDSSQSGGFRNLSLNLVVVDEHTCQASTDSHIVEVQLTLRPIHELKSDGGHRRYTRFRDLRAE